MATPSASIAASNVKATDVRCSTPYLSAIAPMVKFTSMFPTSAMVRTILNAVPDTEAYRLPVSPSMTGNPAANTMPISTSPATATGYEPGV